MSEDKELQENVGKKEYRESSEASDAFEEKIADNKSGTTSVSADSANKTVEESNTPEGNTADNKAETTMISTGSSKETVKESDASEEKIADNKTETISVSSDSANETIEESDTSEEKIADNKTETMVVSNDFAKETAEESNTSQEKIANNKTETTAVSDDTTKETVEELNTLEEKIADDKTPASNSSKKGKDNELAETPSQTEEAATTEGATSKEKVDVLEEIDENNAEDAEDTDNHHRHGIPLLDYHSMSMENLVGELQRLIRNEKVQAIKNHVDGIKSEFDLKFQEFIEHKKEAFIESGGNEIDFRYNSVTKKQFNEVHSDYREKRNQYYKSLEKDLKANLTKRLEIIDSLKALVNVDEDMNTTYKAFKDLQEDWRNAGPVPRTSYNDVWRTYQHHIEIFYDFLHLNRELRDLDFKHNLAEKEKLVQQAEALATEPDLNRVFRELQSLHKIWKEDIGPVGQEHREAIWERFSDATKVLHQRRQEHYKQLDAEYEENLVKKHEIIGSISTLANNIANNHKGLQQQIKKLEGLRNEFFNAGKVPRNQNEKTWAAFKDAVRNFNSNKNVYYKNLKKDQQENLDKKRELLNLAISLKDSEDWDTTTSEFKRIQGEWKKIGHVPRRYSDKIWIEFKNACNHYFDRLHALKNKGFKEEAENFEKKNACLERLKAFETTDRREIDLKAIKSFIEEWKSFGRVPFKKKNIDQKFHKILDTLFKKLDVSRQEAELLKYGNKIQHLADSDNEHAIQNERNFIRKKIEEGKGEIRQLETNLQFFSNASEDNPLVQDVIKRVESHKESLASWKAKLKKLNIMENSLNKEGEEGEIESSASQEEK